jgi:hypothetical protein
MLVICHNHCLALQHIKGELNLVADLLSFAGTTWGKRHPIAHNNPLDPKLTQRFHTHYRSQIPENFVISPLPQQILLWVIMVMQTHESYLICAKKTQTKP